MSSESNGNGAASTYGDLLAITRAAIIYDMKKRGVPLGDYEEERERIAADRAKLESAEKKYAQHLRNEWQAYRHLLADPKAPIPPESGDLTDKARRAITQKLSRDPMLIFLREKKGWLLEDAGSPAALRQMDRSIDAEEELRLRFLMENPGEIDELTRNYREPVMVKMNGVSPHNGMSR